MLLPPTCPGCGTLGAAPCERCHGLLVPASPAEVPEGLDRFTALFSYEGLARELIIAMKYRNHTDAIGSLAAELCWVAQPHVDVVAWLPTSGRRRRHRGFDQAELLARHAARRLEIPLVALLRRRSGAPQTGRSRQVRAGVEFRCRRRPAPRVLLIDDVLTTGASLGAAARCCKSAGASLIHGAVIAVTPARRDENEIHALQSEVRVAETPAHSAGENRG